MAITVTDRTRDAFEAFAQVSGVASAQMASKILDDSVPVIEAMTKAFHLAKQSGPDKAMAVMTDVLQGAMVQAAQVSLEFSPPSDSEKKLRRRPVKNSR